MSREITLAQAFGWVIALAASSAALTCACLLFAADREQRAASLALGGLALAVWAAFNLTDRRR